MKTTFYHKVLAALREGVATYGNAAALARASGASPANLSRWLSGERVPRLAEISPVLDLLGVTPTVPSTDAGRDVCFVDAKVVPAGEGVEPPQAEDYLAAPLVGEVGAGPGYLPEEDIKSWFLVYRNLPAIRHRGNLMAVEIGKNSTSMQPLLNPGDIVLVDRNDKDVDYPGHIMLVRDPDGQGMVKRVSVEESRGDFIIQFYSDNAVRNPPMVFSLRSDYLGEWDRAIVGRIIWAWSDVREK